MKHLTPREIEVLGYYDTFTAREGHAPTLQEVATALGVSKQRIEKQLGYLQASGYVERERQTARGVRVVKLPGGAR